MRQRITYVAAYADITKAPGVTPHMECMGGELSAVQFNDALEELTNLREAVQALLDAEMDHDECDDENCEWCKVKSAMECAE